MSIADRAVAEFEADQDARQLEEQAIVRRAQGVAQSEIIAAGERFGIDIAPELIELESAYYHSYKYTTKIDDDADLVIIYTGDPRPNHEKIEVVVKPADQLYWNLPPGQEKKPAGRGGTYGCYGLGSSFQTNCKTLRDVGARLVKIRAARAAWRAKHCAT